MFANENAENSLHLPHFKGNVYVRKSESTWVKNLPSSAEDAGLIFSQGTQIPHATQN